MSVVCSFDALETVCARFIVPYQATATVTFGLHVCLFRGEVAHSSLSMTLSVSSHALPLRFSFSQQLHSTFSTLLMIQCPWPARHRFLQVPLLHLRLVCSRYHHLALELSLLQVCVGAAASGRRCSFFCSHLFTPVSFRVTRQTVFPTMRTSLNTVSVSSL